MDEVWLIRILLGVVGFFTMQFYFRTDKVEKQQIKDREDLNKKISDNALKVELLKSEFIRHSTDLGEMKSDIKSLSGLIHDVVHKFKNVQQENSNLEDIIKQINNKLDRR